MIEFNKLKRWEDSLDACIRCGYCYEHCPIYKATRWEIDAPRGKLILLHGLLAGEIQPSSYIAEKLFECFHCRRCQEACSSGVPTMDVFADARADLRDAGFDVVGTTSVTDPDVCARCLNCVRMCPHEARYFNGQIQTDRLKCQSCGSCLDICSAQAIRIGKGFGTNPDDLRTEMASFLTSPEAKAVVFGCNWSSFPGFQTARYATNERHPEHRVFVTACGGRVPVQVVLDALELGAWGVLLNCCPEDDCDHGGSARAKSRMTALQKSLERIGIQPGRVRVCEVSKTDPKAFTVAVGEFLGELRAYGPLKSGEAP